MHTGVLIPVFDLVAAFFDVHIDAAIDLPHVLCERVPHASVADGQIAGFFGARVEVLMVHHVGRRKDPALRPVDPHEVLVVFIPEEGIALA